MNNNGILTAEQLAEYLGISLRKLREMEKYKIGPLYFRVGKQIRYKKSDIDKWIIEMRINNFFK